MPSIRSVLFSIKDHLDHLPGAWSPSDGLAALFPNNYTGSIFALQNYVYVHYFELATDSRWVRQGFVQPMPLVVANGWFMADGAGNWYFGWRYGPSAYTFFPGPDSTHIEAGFIFKSQVNGSSYGYVDTSVPKSANATSCNSGNDLVIQDNWVQLFAGGVSAFLRIPGGTPPLGPFDIWNGKNAVNVPFVSLSGSTVACQGQGSGSSLFPFPTPSADCYVASIIAGAVATALKAGTPVNADVNLVKQVITSRSFSSPAAQSLSEYIETPFCEQAIADAETIAKQVFTIQTGKTGAAPATGVLSPFVTADQIIAAGTAAYHVLTSAVTIPPITLWNALKEHNA